MNAADARELTMKFDESKDELTTLRKEHIISKIKVAATHGANTLFLGNIDESEKTWLRQLGYTVYTNSISW